MRLLLIRHGESEGNLEDAQPRPGDPPLTERGIRQAEEAGRRVLDEGLDILYCGPLQRNLQTAARIHQISGVKTVLLPAIFEVGANNILWDAKHIARQFPMVHIENGLDTRWSQALPESFQQAWKRIKYIENWLRKTYEATDTRVGLITHGAMNDLLIGACLGLDPGGHMRFSSGNCAFHWVELRSNVGKLLRLNDTFHIPDHDRS